MIVDITSRLHYDKLFWCNAKLKEKKNSLFCDWPKNKNIKSKVTLDLESTFNHYVIPSDASKMISLLVNQGVTVEVGSRKLAA